MRFFHPSDNQPNRMSLGASRRRRERHRQRRQDDAIRQAGIDAQEPRALEWDFWGAPGRILAAEPCEARPHSLTQSDGALRIAQGCGYDPGNAAYRFHSAINETTKHASSFVRFGHTNPFCDLRQIDGDTQLHDARSTVWNADVIHAHVDYLLQQRTGYKWRARGDQLVVRHYHGTRPTGVQWPLLNMLEDDLAGVVLVGARLQLCAVRPSRMQWLPIAVPVRRYRAMVPVNRIPGPFRVTHSPTRADYKGTSDLVAAVEAVKRKGLKIELHMIERQQHGRALELKADGDLTFDSFWLGLQGSGLEAAAMGQMVVAGDETARDCYVKSEVGECPYTFAKDRAQLTEVLERAVSDPEWRAGEAKRVGQYVETFHDYKAVASRYERIIQDVTKWPKVVTPKARGGKRVAP